MPNYDVWAPDSKSVAVKIGETVIPMHPSQNGWWRAGVYGDGTEGDYQFVLDDGEAYPDPRSAWQPDGVHGPSRVVDHSRYRWSDQGWQAPPLASAIIYELHIGTFTPEGTFAAAIDKLDYLVDLGVTNIELMPVAEFPGSRGWGYDGVDLYAPHHAYGGPEGLKQLVNACHVKGLAVILDVVYNHLGPDGNYLGKFGPYFTSHHQTAWGDAVNFDGPGSDEVRRFFIDNALMWLRDYHMDGLRLDAVHAIFDDSAIYFLESLARAVKALEIHLGRHLVLIAESDSNNPRIVRPPAAGGYGIHAQWSDDFHHVLHSLLTGEQSGYYADFGKMADLAQALTQVFVYNNRYSAFRGRTHGRPVINLSFEHVLGYLQNHDQIGNRAQGERINHLINTDLLQIGAALVFTAPFIPMIFQGEEWGASTPFLYFTDHENAEIGRSVSEGRRKEFRTFGWDPQAAETFRSSKLNWDEIGEEPHRSILDWYRQLIRLRKSHPALSPANWETTRVRFDVGAKWFMLKREEVTVLCNFSQNATPVPTEAVSPEEGRISMCLLLASTEQGPVMNGQVHLPEFSVFVMGEKCGEERSHLFKQKEGPGEGPLFVCQATFSKRAPGVPQTGHLSGALRGWVWPQTGQT